MRSQGKGARGGNPGALAGPCALVPLCLAALRELKTRRKAHLPTNDVVETPRKLHGCSCPSLETRTNQSQHVLGEHRVQDQAGGRTAELAQAQPGQTSDRGTLALATKQELLSLILGATCSRTTPGRGSEPRLRRRAGLMPKTTPQSTAGPGGTQDTMAGVTFLALGPVKLIFSFAGGTQTEFPCEPALLNTVLYRNTRAVCSDEAEGKESSPAP